MTLQQKSKPSGRFWQRARDFFVDSLGEIVGLAVGF